MSIPAPQEAGRETTETSKKVALAIANLLQESVRHTTNPHNKADAMLVMTFGVGAGANVLASVIGRCPEGKDTNDPANYVNEVSVLTAAIFAAKACAVTVNGGIHAEFSPVIMAEALDAVEKIIGKSPDEYLDQEMVRQTRGLMAESGDVLRAFMESRQSTIQ